MKSLEERKNIRSAAKFIFLTIVTLGLLFFFGIPALGKFAAFVSDIAKGDKPITRNDTTPPAPPQIELPPEFTNQKDLKITGRTEEGATLKASFNGEEKEVVADSDGQFSFDLSLNKGENTFSIKAVDTAGNESQSTKTFKIIFDNKVPDLSIDTPSDGAQFFGIRQRQIEISGKTEENAQVTINDRFVVVEDDGSFQFTTTLNEGENKFTVKATDQAGNASQKELTVTFTS